MIVRSFLQVFTFLCSAISLQAAAAVGNDEIKAAVNQFLASYSQDIIADYGDTVRVEYSIKSLDPRLAMTDCPSPLLAEHKSINKTGNVNIKVSCQQKNLWSLYIPVAIDLFRPVVIAINPIIKGGALSQSQLAVREINVARINGTYFTDINKIIGMQAKRSIRADKPILAQFIEPPLMIKRGESVQMTAEGKGLTVKIPAIALSDGHKGQQISVRNKQSKRVVEATVSAPGQVIIPM